MQLNRSTRAHYRWTTMAVVVLTVASATFSCVRSNAAPPTPPDGFTWAPNEMFSDEFNAARLDLAKWYDHHPRWKGRPPAKFMPATVSVKSGRLQIRNRAVEYALLGH